MSSLRAIMLGATLCAMLTTHGNGLAVQRQDPALSEPANTTNPRELSKKPMTPGQDLWWEFQLRPIINVVEVGISGSGWDDVRDGHWTFEEDNLYKGVLLNEKVHALLIEPNPLRYRSVTTSKYGCCNPRLTVKQGSIAHFDGEQGEKKWYTIWDRIIKDYPMTPKWLVTDVGSVNYDYVVWYASAAGLSQEEFKKYIWEAPVTNFGPEAILQEAFMDPHDVDILKISSHGDEPDILNSFFQIEHSKAFKPLAVIMRIGTPGDKKHHALTQDALNHVITTMSKRGYKHDCTRQFKFWQCGHDVTFQLASTFKDVKYQAKKHMDKYGIAYGMDAHL